HFVFLYPKHEGRHKTSQLSMIPVIPMYDPSPGCRYRRCTCQKCWLCVGSVELVRFGTHLFNNYCHLYRKEYVTYFCLVHCMSLGPSKKQIHMEPDRKTILLIDDDPETRQLISEILEMADYAVHSA